MIQRITSAMIMLIVCSVCLFLSEWTRLALLLAVAFVACQEMLGALRAGGYSPKRWPGYLCCVCIVPIVLFMDDEAAFMSFFVVVIMAVFCHRILSKNMKTVDVFSSLAVLIYPMMPIAFIIVAASQSAPYWYSILIVGVAAACVTDIFALFSGMLFGKHKLCPDISPKKTVEGAVGGFVFGTLAGFLCWWAQPLWGGQTPLYMYLIACALCSIAGQLGDLAASCIKRATGIKDFGKLIPGHGGILDRLDSILFSVPIAYIFFARFVISVVAQVS